MRLHGDLTLPGDKSISHRAIMLNAISYGTANIYNFLESEDSKATVNIFRQLGVSIEKKEDHLVVKGNGFEGLKPAQNYLDCLNSGTTARLLFGILSGLDFETRLIGDDSLSKRPMKRVSIPLTHLGAKIELFDNNKLPARILPSAINASKIELEVASAQVKSAVILAALKSQEVSTIIEKEQTRNHTELMLKYLGADITTRDLEIRVSGKHKLLAKDIYVPSDLSSAAFFIVACLILPNSTITLRNVGLNPTRTGILKVLDQIGASYDIDHKKEVCNELVGDLTIHYTPHLLPFHLSGAMIPLLVDEIPILTLLATQIEGVSTIKDATELRVKESDRIHITTSELNKLGANIIEHEDGMTINGKTSFHKAHVNSFHDHRISMMLKVAQLLCQDIVIENSDCDKISYPNFTNDLHKLLK